MASSLARQIPGAVHVYDPRPHEERTSAWRTYRWALERALVPSCEWSHVLVIQDDTLLCAHFNELLPRVVEAQPDALVALYHSAVPIYNAVRLREAGAAHIPFAALSSQTWLPVVANVWPVELIEPLLEYVDRQRWPADWTADDEIVGRAARNLGLDVLATVPSLVQHPDEVVSIAGRRRPSHGKNPQRVALLFDPEADLREVDWSQEPYMRRF